MKKLQSYIIYKFSSSRLKRTKYNLNISLSEAISNIECVRIGNCQLLKSIRKIENRKEYDPSLEQKLRQLRNRKRGQDEKKILELRNKIESQLFIDSIIYVEFDDVRHYEQIIKKGLFINGEEFVRLLSSAGNARKKTVMFCKKSIYEKLDYLLDCGRNQNYKINGNKYNAYYSLCASGGHEIPTPRIVVIPDRIVKRNVQVDFCSENPDPLDDPIIEQKEVELEFNSFDGEGLMSRTFANMIAYELELDYTPAYCIVRSAYIKGVLATFDFKEFSEEFCVDTFIDIYGKKVDADDVDVILTESQFKLHGAYESTEQYLKECSIRDYGWSVTRVAPKQDRNVTMSNYQFLQVLNLDDKDIQNLISPTVDYLSNISGLDHLSSVLFLMGDIKEDDLSKKWFDNLDSTVKQLLFRPEVINDQYIQNKLRRMLEKKVNESCEGKLLIDGNYQIMLADVFALAQWAFGTTVTGLLKEGEVYSRYWNFRKENKIAALRNPLTWRNEVNILNVKKSEELDKWYHYSTTGIMYNIFDNSTLTHAGSDWDGDGIVTTNNQQIIDKSYQNYLPVAYEKNIAPKQTINKNELWKMDSRVFKNLIGFLTNLSTTMYSILSKYNEGSLEYGIVANRIKTTNVLQNLTIDYGKGIDVMPIPKHWSTWQKWDDDDPPSEITLKKQHNKLLVDHRPYFMIYTYPQKAKLYKRHMEIYDDYSRTHFGMNINELVKQGSDENTDKQKCIDFFYRYNPIIDSPSVMNKICHAVENKIKIKRNKSDFAWSFPDMDKDKLNKMAELYKSWKNEKKAFNNHGVDGYIFVDVSRTYRQLADAISTNSKEIAKLALMINRRFANTVFIDDVLNLFYVKDIQVPVLSEDGDKLFNGNKYKIVSFSLEE